MQVTIISLTEKGLEQREDRDIYVIEIDGKKVFEVYDGEPEDATLSRDFNDVIKIPELMKMAHLEGAMEDALEIEYKQVDEY